MSCHVIDESNLNFASIRHLPFLSNALIEKFPLSGRFLKQKTGCPSSLGLALADAESIRFDFSLSCVGFRTTHLFFDVIRKIVLHGLAANNSSYRRIDPRWFLVRHVAQLPRRVLPKNTIDLVQERDLFFVKGILI